jgi:hypothetical protein
VPQNKALLMGPQFDLVSTISREAPPSVGMAMMMVHAQAGTSGRQA